MLAWRRVSFGGRLQFSGAHALSGDPDLTQFRLHPEYVGIGHWVGLIALGSSH